MLEVAPTFDDLRDTTLGPGEDFGEWPSALSGAILVGLVIALLALAPDFDLALTLGTNDFDLLLAGVVALLQRMASNLGHFRIAFDLGIARTGDDIHKAIAHALDYGIGGITQCIGDGQSCRYRLFDDGS